MSKVFIITNSPPASFKAFILADSTKFDMIYFANVAKLEEATIITDKKEINKDIEKHTKIINIY